MFKTKLTFTKIIMTKIKCQCVQTFKWNYLIWVFVSVYTVCKVLISMSNSFECWFRPRTSVNAMVKQRHKKIMDLRWLLFIKSNSIFFNCILFLDIVHKQHIFVFWLLPDANLMENKWSCSAVIIIPPV